MRGDNAQWTTAGGDAPPVHRGPRHAAPRKSLLTKLQIPAGKAIALAAMPTAVFVGMGLTPRLALASDNQDIPFLPGPCVTRSDEPDPSESPSGSPSGSPTPSTSPSASPGPSDPVTPRPTPSESGTATTPAPPGSSEPADDTAPAPPASSSPPAGTPAPTSGATRNPLDPLGLGDALGDLLGGGKKPTADAPRPSGSAVPDTPTSPVTSPSSHAPEPDEPSGKPTGKPAGKPSGDPGDAVEEAIKDAADKAGATVEELDEDAKGLDARKDEDIPEEAGGKEPFPCPTADPKALAAAEEEQGIPALPNEPWTLRSSLLTLNGLDYHGIVKVRTAGGELKNALKFTASSVDIKDLHQIWNHPAGGTGHTTGGDGTTSTIRGGEVTMYTEELKGNLFGLIPITFSPETPPPVNVPFAFFTDVTVRQAGQFGGTLTIPDLRNYVAN